MTAEALQPVRAPVPADAAARPPVRRTPAPAAVTFHDRKATSEGSEAAEAASQAGVPGSPYEEAVKVAAEQIESYLRKNGRTLEFRVDDDTGRIVVSVRDAAMGALIRQIPSEEILRLARALGEGSGALVDLAI